MLKALGSGLMGAFTLTLVHEAARRFIDDAPRMDVVGMRAITKAMEAAGTEPPVPLHEAALVGDIVTNSLYYGLVGLGDSKDALRNGAILGLAAGLGAVFLPEPLGLGRQPTEDSPQTELMTVAWYILGGLAAGAAYSALGSDDE
ncbi:MAG TPA: hypothetical protein VGP08_13815 [Pyrinomonadaceae bacterium]|jgi:hypothetical protein|nr:hypothetical protein [Pyrinomonadaceae bacterium]